MGKNRLRKYYHGFASVDPESGIGVEQVLSDRVYTDPGLVDGEADAATSASIIGTGQAIDYTINGIFYTLAQISTIGDCRGFSTHATDTASVAAAGAVSTRHVVIGVLVGIAGATSPIWNRSTAALTAADLPTVPADQLLIGYVTQDYSTANSFSSLAPYPWGNSLASHGAVFFDGTPTAAVWEPVTGTDGA